MKFWQVDAFTRELFKGNSAAVFVLTQDIPDSLKQVLAQEMNLSETVFVIMKDGLHIRWFTPKSEVNLCGHATLAAAHILWEQKFIQDTEITFASKSGPLKVSRSVHGYTLDFPSQPSCERRDYIDLVTDLLGQTPTYIGSNNEDCAAVVEDPKFVKNWIPDFDKISQLKECGFILTSRSPDGYDFIYRAFFPKLGVPEDPVTGSAQTLLASYWSSVLQRQDLRAYQASPRGGQLFIDVSKERVLITGEAVTVFEGTMNPKAFAWKL